MGNARLFYSLRQRNVAIRFETPLHELILENGQVVGAVVLNNGQPQRIRARRGVVLATGGVTRHPTLRKQLFPAAAQPLSLAPMTHTGDGIDRALKANAQLDNGQGQPRSVDALLDPHSQGWLPGRLATHPARTAPNQV